MAVSGLVSAPGPTTITIITAIAILRRFGVGTIGDRAIMATSADYTAVANALVQFFTREAHTLPEFEQNFIPMDKIPAAAGATAKVAVDALDAHRAQEKTP